MKRIQALLATTWWLWIINFSAVMLLGVFVEPVAFVCVPFLFVVFFYFAFVRYDAEGNHRP